MKQWNGLLKERMVCDERMVLRIDNYASMHCPFPIVCQYFHMRRSKCDGDIADI